MNFHEEKKIHEDSIISKLLTPLTSKEQIFGVFPNTARYAFTAYFPQAVVTYLLDKINTPPLIILYAQRIVAFLFYPINK